MGADVFRNPRNRTRPFNVDRSTPDWCCDAGSGLRRDRELLPKRFETDPVGLSSEMRPDGERRLRP